MNTSRPPTGGPTTGAVTSRGAWSRTSGAPGAPGSPGAAQRPGPVRPLGVDDIFFSATDESGLITSCNSVFSRITEYPPAELLGRPHSLVRHPDMPAGVFHIMWERLRAGLPMAGYLLNTTRSGASHWVYATVTPLRSGFLSVRTAPATQAFTALQGLYPGLREHEREVVAQGTEPREAAREGARLLLERLKPYGVTSYDDFIAMTLPAEVGARTAHSEHRMRSIMSTMPRGARGSRGFSETAVWEVLGAVAQVEQQLRTLAPLLEKYSRLTYELRDLAVRLTATRRATAVAASTALAQARSHPVLSNVANLLQGPATGLAGTLDHLAYASDEAAAGVAALSVGIAFGLLHTEMIAVFAGEVLRGEPGSVRADVRLLCEALDDEMYLVSEGLHEVNQQLLAAAEAAERVTGDVSEFTRLLGMWRILMMRHQGMGGGGELDTIESLLQTGQGLYDALRIVPQHCRAALEPVGRNGFDVDLCRAYLQRMGETTDRL